MHARRFACFCLGMWLAGGLFMAWVATQNFREVDRLLSRDDPAATLRLKPLGSEARAVLRYAASENNRWLFVHWETVQFVFGSCVFGVMLFGSRENKFVLLGLVLLLLTVLFQKFFITPEVVSLGRLIDFIPASADTPDQRKFWVMHGFYSGVELAKWCVILILAGSMVFSRRRSGRSRDSRNQLDRVDKRYHGGVNR